MKIQRGTLAFIFIMFYSFFKNFYEDNNRGVDNVDKW